jgi:biopolymer transport protein ExbD
MIEFERPKPFRHSLEIAPLIDIIFLLLLFFLLTSVFIEPGIPLDLPEAATAAFQQDQSEQVVYITRTEEIYLNDRPVSIDELSVSLAERLRTHATSSLTIKADQDVPFGTFVRVLDIAKQAGGQDVVIAAKFPR